LFLLVKTKQNLLPRYKKTQLWSNEFQDLFYDPRSATYFREDAATGELMVVDAEEDDSEGDGQGAGCLCACVSEGS